MTQPQSQVWLVTGTSTGIGRVLAEYLAEQGDRVVATARDITKIQDLQARFPEQIHIVRQDVNLEADNHAAVAEAVARFGRIDVLMNNAGYGLEGVVEECTMAQVRDQMETNFFGLVHLTQCVLPIMRAQQSGYIINVASIAGLRGFGGLSVYNASKFAVVGLSEGLAGEVRPFGIRVSIVEPGPYRTDWAGRSLVKTKQMQERTDSPYAHLNATVDESMRKADGNQPGDPRQIASVLFSASRSEKPPLHLLFGDMAIQVWEDKLKRYQDPSFMDKFPHTRTSL